MQYEKMLLGQMLTDNSIITKVQLNPSDFYSPDNYRYYEAILKCLDDGITADIVTVGTHLTGKDPAKIASLTDGVVSTANWQFYEAEIKKASIKRKLLALVESVKNEITDFSPTDMIEKIEDELTDITKDFKVKSSYSFKESMPGFVDELQKRYNLKDQLLGISTGLKRLDEYILGFQDKFLYYIGARPSGGKSALLLNMALYAMLKEKKTVGIISAESSLNEILTRSFAQEGKINSMQLLSGNYSEQTFGQFTTLLELFHAANGVICDEPNISLQFLKREIRKMVKVQKCDIIYLDYVQLISNKNADNVRDRVSETSIALKMLARKLSIPIVAAAQLRRDSENKRPTMADFADSSQIEKDADVAIMIYHKDENSYLCIEKVRDGKSGDIAVYFKKEYVRFYQREGNWVE